MAVWALMTGGALYAVFHGSALVGGGLTDGLWVVGLSIHAVLIILIIVGLVTARSHLGLDGWSSRVWNTSIVFAFLGLTASHPLWSLALLGLAVVTFARLGSVAVAALLASGGLGWLYLFWIGARVGDENGPTPTDGQVAIGVAALILMALGVIGLGLNVRRAHVPATQSDRLI